MKCTVTDITDDFRPIQIPNNATFVDKLVLGSNAEADTGVTVVQWRGNTTNPSGMYANSRYIIIGQHVWLVIILTAGEYFIQVTDTGCFPINDFFYDAERDDLFENL